MDDLISRQAAIDALNEYFARIGKLKRRGLTKGEKAISLDTVGALKTLPSAEPKTGKWILQDTSYWRATHAGDVQVNRVNLKCSFCGWRNHEKKKYNYCPNCGAKMVREDGEA